MALAHIRPISPLRAQTNPSPGAISAFPPISHDLACRREETAAAAAMQELKEDNDLRRGKVTPVILDLEESLKAKGDMTKNEVITIRGCKVVAGLFKFFCTTAFSSGTFFVLGLAPKFGEPPVPRIPKIGLALGIAWFAGKVTYHSVLQASAGFILKCEKEDMKRMKMELANIILNKHSDEKTLVECVKRSFFAEHLFSDQYEDKPLFRCHPRHTYVESAFMERVKEIELKNSNDGSGSVSGQRTTSIRSFGDLMEDPLACILGSPDSNTESNKSAEHTAFY
uniref:Uncharacterized protein n=1 Tax=Leersia perrieri TaxID=77586 RepID=A0A0D9XJX3_9ORYZ